MKNKEKRSKIFSATIRRMRYFYRRYRMAKELRKNCRLNAPKKEVVFPPKTRGTILISKDEKMPKEPFVDWFSRDYISKDIFPTFRHWKLLPKMDLNEMIKYFHSVIDDLTSQDIVKEENGRIYVNPLRNEFIDGFWYRTFSVLLNNIYVKAVILGLIGIFFTWWGKTIVFPKI